MRKSIAWTTALAACAMVLAVTLAGPHSQAGELKEIEDPAKADAAVMAGEEQLTLPSDDLLFLTADLSGEHSQQGSDSTFSPTGFIDLAFCFQAGGGAWKKINNSCVNSCSNQWKVCAASCNGNSTCLTGCDNVWTSCCVTCANSF